MNIRYRLGIYRYNKQTYIYIYRVTDTHTFFYMIGRFQNQENKIGSLAYRTQKTGVQWLGNFRCWQSSSFCRQHACYHPVVPWSWQTSGTRSASDFACIGVERGLRALGCQTCGFQFMLIISIRKTHRFISIPGHVKHSSREIQFV